MLSQTNKLYRSKYPIAITETLLEALGSNIGGGYDVGCKFATTLSRSPLGPLARKLNYSSLVGAFHGHGHQRKCQLDNLATYVEGMGLEDLEGCERFFSKSNALAASLRYASIFHRKQKIVEFMKHMDTFETYPSLSEWVYIDIDDSNPFTGLFLVNNYNQALKIIATEPALKETMESKGIKDTDVFRKWLAEEKEYLNGLSKEPIQETLEMEYYQKLVNLRDSE